MLKMPPPSIYMVFRKNCGFFFTIHCNPSLAYIAVRDLQSSQRKMRMYSHSYWLVFFVQPLAAECWRGKGFENSWKKTQYLMNTLYKVGNAFI